jgi:RHS repeat-associated protein
MHPNGSEEYYFWLGSKKLGAYTLGTNGSGSLAVASGVGTLWFGNRKVLTQDRIGSTTNNYYPYGEDGPTAPPSDADKFATYYRDLTTGLDYADHRYYSSSLGRFLTPDPYMAGAGGANSPSDPKTWNRYTYASGDPINGRDPLGLLTCFYVNGVLDSCEGDDSPGPQNQNVAEISYQAVAQAIAANDAASLAGKVFRGQMTDCQALAQFADDNAAKSSTAFFQSFGVLTPSQFGTDVSDIASSTSPIKLNSGQASGFQSEYQNTTPDNPTSGWNGDQGHHFAAFFQLGQEWNPPASYIGSALFEVGESLLHLIKGQGWDLNDGDIRLGAQAAGLGWAVSKGLVAAKDVGNWIRNNICAK